MSRACESAASVMESIDFPSKLPDTVLNMDYKKIIMIEPGKRGGQPCIRNLRITVYDILEYLASGMGEDQILNDFPELNSEDIQACLSFAADREKKLIRPTL